MSLPRSRSRSSVVASIARPLSALAFFLLGMLITPIAPACEVPVFRYALERWEPVPYRAIVFHRGPLPQAERQAVKLLQDAGQIQDAVQFDSEQSGEAAKDTTPRANLLVEIVDLGGKPDAALKAIHDQVSPPKLPWMVLMRPQPMGPLGRSPVGDQEPAAGKQIWSGPFEPSLADRLLNSPARRELARRLLQGDSAVWLLLESGDKAKDTAAAELLSTNLKKLQGELKLPSDAPSNVPGADAAGDQPPADTHGQSLTVGPKPAPGVPLRLTFSIQNLSRRDPAEAMLLDMLMTCGTKPVPKDAPAAFIVFGRGRVLDGLFGEDLDPDIIARACEFLIGECSCQIKDSQPGTDLLMTAEWQKVLAGALALDKALPPLTSIMVPPPAKVPAVAATGPSVAALPDEPSPAEDQRPAADPLLRNVVLALAAVVAVALGGTLLLRRFQAQ